MSTRHIVLVGRDDTNGLTVSLWKSPVGIPTARDAKPLGCDPAQMPSWNQPEAVRIYGSQLYDKLTTAHTAIKQVLTTALQTPNENPTLYFYLFADGAESLSWETLYAPPPNSGFLALDRQWAIARMADTSANSSRPPVAILDSPLRVLAFLSAHNVPADEEWEELKSATATMRGANQLHLYLLIGEERLYDAIATDISNNALVGIDIAPMPQRIDQIKAVMDRVGPQVLHVFSHGSVGYGDATLQMSHFGDAGNPNGSLSLSISELTRFESMRNVWVVTLNCCDSGTPTPDMHSMARYLVEQGVPAALGMTEPIAPDDAHEVCRAFYSSLFAYLGQRFAATPGASQVEIEWSKALYAARSGLRDHHQGDAKNRREWTLPVMYVCPDPFFVSPRIATGIVEQKHQQQPIASADLLRIQAVAGLLKSLPPDTPRDLRLQLLDVLSAFPEEVRPDEFGTFKTPMPAAAAAPQPVSVSIAGV